MRGKNIIGLIIIILGVGLLLQQLEVFNFSTFIKSWWPAIFIIIGLLQLVNNRRSAKIPGLFFLVLGGILLSRKIWDINVFEFIWPIILIFIGCVFLFSRKSHKKPVKKGNTIKKDIIHHTSIFSGATMQNNSSQFKGGDITAIFGGVKIDLRDAFLDEDGGYLEISTLFGGATLTLPEHMNIEVTGTPIFGGWEDKTRRRQIPNDGPTLKVKCVTIFGGVTIKD